MCLSCEGEVIKAASQKKCRHRKAERLPVASLRCLGGAVPLLLSGTHHLAYFLHAFWQNEFYTKREGSASNLVNMHILK